MNCTNGSSGVLRATLVLGFLVSASGCSKQNAQQDSLPTKSDMAASENPRDLQNSMPYQLPVDADAALSSVQLPVMAEFPSTRFINAGGYDVGKRDLHGLLCLVQIGNKHQAGGRSAVLARHADRLKQQRYGRYVSAVLLAGLSDSRNGVDSSAERTDSASVSDRHLLWASAGPLDDSFWSRDDLPGSIILLDPIGRVRGVFPAGADDELDSAAASVWDEQVPFLNEVMDSSWMDARRDAQLMTRNAIKVQHDFQFRDVRSQTGIRFLHQIVDDAAKDYKGVHYDHGSGLTIADVDGDGLCDVYFVNQLGKNSLYHNNGNGTFSDVTERAGVGVGDRICVTASFADIDNDGDADLYVTSVRKGNLLFVNDGGGKFSDATEVSGLGYKGHSSGAVFFDFDRDGLLDLYLCNVGQYTTEETGRGGYYIGFKDAFSGHLKPERTESSRLYRNRDGKSFEEVTEAFGLTDNSWSGDAAICDFDGDGWLDLYVLDMQGNDEYFENQQGAGFAKKSRHTFPKTPWGAMGIAIADFDNDLDLDIFVTDMHSDMSKDILADIRSEISMNTFFLEEKDKATMKLPESLLKSEGASVYGNAFFRNDGNGVFAEDSIEFHAENYWPWGLSSGDINADGFEDAFVTSSMNYPFRYGVNSLLLNDGQRFHDAEFIVGIEPRSGGRTAQPWMQIDCKESEDTLLKKVTAGKTGEITVWGALGSRASVLLDIDNDGDLDIITNEFNDVPLVLESDLAQRHEIHFVKIKLVGTKSSRCAFGAQLTISTATGRKLCQYDGRVGYLSQGIPELYVGLGDAKEVDSICVVWPGGDTEVFEGPWVSGTTIQLTESK